MNKREKFYSIDYLYLTDKTDCGVSSLYMHLPCTNRVTHDKEKALKWFDEAVKCAVKQWNGNELIEVKDEPLDYRCKIKTARFKCNEVAYMKGEYLIELNCFNHNPLL